MASIYQLKPRFQALLRPLVASLARAGVTPNQITAAALLLSVAVGAVLAWRRFAGWPLLLLPAALLVRMALNALDGMLAREHGLASPLGAFLNELGDVLSDAALYLPLALRPDFGGAFGGAIPAMYATELIVAIVVAAALSEMAGVVAVQVGASRRYDGPMGKSDRAAVFGALALLLAGGVEPGGWLTLVLIAVLGLLVLTIVNRVRRALREIAAP